MLNGQRCKRRTERGWRATEIGIRRKNRERYRVDRRRGNGASCVSAMKTVKCVRGKRCRVLPRRDRSLNESPFKGTAQTVVLQRTNKPLPGVNNSSPKTIIFNGTIQAAEQEKRRNWAVFHFFCDMLRVAGLS